MDDFLCLSSIPFLTSTLDNHVNTLERFSISVAVGVSR
jgi:hypothetical protein